MEELLYDCRSCGLCCAAFVCFPGGNLLLDSKCYMRGHVVCGERQCGLICSTSRGPCGLN